jgi:hypothetical protein
MLMYGGDMCRKLVTVRKISELLPIEGADAIELAVVDGWKCVVRKGEFTDGDYAVYFEIDSFLPSTDKRFDSFMKSSREYLGVIGHKLRTIKLRRQISQGLAMPVKLFPEILSKLIVPSDGRAYELSDVMFDNTPLAIHALVNENFSQIEGIDFAEVIGIVKWEPPVSGSVQGQAAGSFPSFIRKTDQERHQNLKDEIFGYEDRLIEFDTAGISDEAIIGMEDSGRIIYENKNNKYFKVIKAKASPDAQYEVTLKLDGTSCTYFKRDGEVGVCSRNLELKINDENIASNALVNIFVHSGLQTLFSGTGGRNLAFQGEVMGPGIQGNRENFKHPTFYLFDIFDIDAGEFLAPRDRQAIFTDMINLGANPKLIKHVPIISQSATLQELGITDTESLIKYADGPSINHKIREGVVFKRIDGKFSFKSISNTFLAKEKD